MSGGAAALAGLAVNGFPTIQSMITNGNLNFTGNSTSYAIEFPGKGEAGFYLTQVSIY